MDSVRSLPQCLHYHPASELSKLPGYYPNISDAQLAAATEVMRTIKEEGLNFNTDKEDSFLKVLRFLRARKFNVKNALHMIREDVKWRSEQNRLNLMQETAEEVLNCEVKLLYQYFPVWFQGFDKQMRPVSYRQFGKFEIWNVLKLTSLERLVRFHAWETEQALRSMYELSERTGYNIETFVLVIDAAGWNLKLATTDAFAFIKGMAVTDSDHYPERLGTMVIINAPTVLAFAWKVIQGFLDAVTKEKIRILSDPADWQPVLQQYIDKDQIPQQYGGTARNLTADEAISMMNPPKSDATVAVGEASAGQAAPRLMTEGRNRTPFAPRTSHVFANDSPVSDLSVSPPPMPMRGVGGRRLTVTMQRAPTASETALSSSGSERGMGPGSRRSAGMVDCSTQTDEGVMVVANEVDRARRAYAQCAVM